MGHRLALAWAHSWPNGYYSRCFLGEGLQVFFAKSSIVTIGYFANYFAGYLLMAKMNHLQFFFFLCILTPPPPQKKKISFFFIHKIPLSLIFSILSDFQMSIIGENSQHLNTHNSLKSEGFLYNQFQLSN